MQLFNNNKVLDFPWGKYYKNVDTQLKILDASFYSYFEQKSLQFSNLYSLDYYGNKIKYNELFKQIDECARGLYDYGVRKGDVVTICLPNTVEGVVSFLAINKIGAVANFIHPLSSENEIKDSLNQTNSRILIILDSNYFKIKNIEKEINIQKVILVSVYNYLPFIAKMRYKFEKKVKFESTDKYLCILWNIFLVRAKKLKYDNYVVGGSKDSPAMILYSGGTTGIPKGVVLSNGNLMAYIESDIILSPNLYSGDSILAIMPIFHGFGIVSNILFSLCMGMLVVLRPKFDVNEYYDMIVKYKPQALSGVPTLFESVFDKIDKSSIKLDSLKYVVAGGDALKPSQRAKINEILRNHGSSARVTVGYGLTEAVCAAVIESNYIDLKEGTVGIPFPGVNVGIFSDDNIEVPYGNEGEICISGPTVMLGYYNNKEETDLVLKKHNDGNIWLHTGDLGSMDEDGYLTYISRIKRMIISSGYNVYPSRLEEILESHPAVLVCAVVGISHKRKIEVPKAYIVLNQGYDKNDSLLMELKKLCSDNLPKYAMPYEYEFVQQLPVTKLGKVDYKNLNNVSTKGD